MNDQDEVERLRARVVELESRLATEEPAETEPTRIRSSRWWAVSAAVLLTLACVLAPLSVASVWARSQLNDTDQYVDTVAPLAQDPAVQKAVADEVTTAVVDNLDLEQVTTEALRTLAAQPDVPPRVAAVLPGLAVPIANGVESFTRDQVQNLLATPQFAALWAQANRIAHDQVTKLLEGNQGGAISAQGNTITLNLGPIIGAVKQRLVAAGFDLAQNIPTVDKTFTLVQSDTVSQARGFYQLLNTLGLWLPFVVLGLFVAGVLLARDRRRALLRGALGITASMLVLGVGLMLARAWYVSTTPADVLTEQAAGNVFDTLVRFLRTALRAAAVLGLVVALAAFLAGPSAAARRTLATVERGIGSARTGAETAGWATGQFGGWVYGHKRALRISVLILGGLVLAFASRPTAWFVVGLAVVVVLLLAVVEFLAVPPAPAGAAAPAEGTAGPVGPAGPEGAVAEPASPAATVPRQMSRTDEETRSAAGAETEKPLQPAEKGPDHDG